MHPFPRTQQREIVRDMTMQLHNDAARRLARGQTRTAVTASALFGRSCRRLDSPGSRTAPSGRSAIRASSDGR